LAKTIYIYGEYSVFWAGNSPKIRSYTVYLLHSGAAQRRVRQYRTCVCIYGVYGTLVRKLSTCCILVLHNVEFASTVRVYVYTACTVLWLGNSLLAAFWYCTYIELAIAAHVYVHTAQTVVWADHPGAPAFL